MTPIQLVQTLQLTDSFFPVGAFAYSDGLESAATAGLVQDAGSLEIWMNHFLDAVFIPCDGLALAQSMQAISNGDYAALCRIDEELTAIKPSAAVRASSTSIGRRLLSAYGAIIPDAGFPSVPCGNAAIAYAIVFSHRKFETRDALLAFGYNRLAGIVSAALRLISIGQQQGQALLTKTSERLPAAVACILEMENEPLRSFSPLLDIQQMNHQYVYSRLFRS